MSAALAGERGGWPVPVLMYHEIDGPGASRPAGAAVDPYSLSRTELAAVLDLLAGEAWHTPPFAELLGPGAVPPARSLVLTFDDARLGVLEHALPLFAERGLLGVVYAITGRVGQPGYCDAAGLRTLRQAGWTVGSHTVSHRHLTGLSPSELRAEWRDSRAALEDWLGSAVEHASLPGGRGGPREAAEAEAAGLRSLACSVPGLWHGRATERFAIPRLVGNRLLQGQRLSRALRGDPRYLLPVRLRHGALGLLKRSLGDARYDGLRQRLLGVGAGEQG